MNDGGFFAESRRVSGKARNQTNIELRYKMTHCFNPSLLVFLII